MKDLNIKSPNELLTVCGGDITESEKFPNELFRGERVYFCTEACREAFKSDPDRFMAGEIEHPLDDATI